MHGGDLLVALGWPVIVGCSTKRGRLMQLNYLFQLSSQIELPASSFMKINYYFCKTMRLRLGKGPKQQYKALLRSWVIKIALQLHELPAVSGASYSMLHFRYLSSVSLLFRGEYCVCKHNAMRLDSNFSHRYLGAWLNRRSRESASICKRQ